MSSISLFGNSSGASLFQGSQATQAGGVGSGNFGNGFSYAQTALKVGAILSSQASEEQKIQGVQDQIGLAVADAYTFGLASVAYGFIDKHFPGVTKFLHNLDAKFNPVTRLLTSMFDSDKWKTEGNRLGALMDKGVVIPPEFQGAMHLTRGRTDEELIDHSVPEDFVGTKADGTWVNNKFAKSRDEKDLHPEDIWGYACFFEKFGNDWLGKFSPEDRRVIAQSALDLGSVREHIGTIDIKWTPELEAAVTQQLGRAKTAF